MQLWRDSSKRGKAAQCLRQRFKTRRRLQIQQTAMTCWYRQLIFSQQRRYLIAVLKPPGRARACSGQAFLEWRKLAAQQWTFRRSLHQTLQPLMQIQLRLSLLQASWKGWHDATQHSRHSAKHKRAVGAWACGCINRQAADITSMLLLATMRCWHGFSRQQASRKRLQIGMLAKAHRAATRTAMEAWQRFHQEQVNLRRLEYTHMCQVLHVPHPVMLELCHPRVGSASNCRKATVDPASLSFC